MKRLARLLFVIGIFISSCNLPAQGNNDPQIATAAALTVQAALNFTPLASPIAGSTNGLAATPAFGQAMASVGDVTNCRTGPGTNYERVTQILPAEPVQIVG